MVILVSILSVFFTCEYSVYLSSTASGPPASLWLVFFYGARTSWGAPGRETPHECQGKRKLVHLYASYGRIIVARAGQCVRCAAGV